MPNEGYEHEMAPEEENRAQPKMREQTVDLLAVCSTSCTCTRSLSLHVPLPHCKHHQCFVYLLSAVLNNQLHSLARLLFFPKVSITV